MPVPPAGVLRITDVTHSTMKLNWDAAPGPVSKYMITYKPDDGELKEVRLLSTGLAPSGRAPSGRAPCGPAPSGPAPCDPAPLHFSFKPHLNDVSLLSSWREDL